MKYTIFTRRDSMNHKYYYCIYQKGPGYSEGYWNPKTKQWERMATNCWRTSLPKLVKSTGFEGDMTICFYYP